MAELVTEASEQASQSLRFADRQLVPSVHVEFTNAAAGCSTCDDSGIMHAFWAPLATVTPPPGQPPAGLQRPMLYLSGPPDALAVRNIGAHGQPLATAADAGTAYLLYAKDRSVRLAKVMADGTFEQDQLLSNHQSSEGTLVADQGGWWAAWTESRSGKLFHAREGWGNVDSPREPVTSELANVLTYGSPSLALGPRNPDDPAGRWIYLAWEMTLKPAVKARLARMQVQAAGWVEHAWLPNPSTHGAVSSPALAYDGALQAAFENHAGVSFMLNPSHTATADRLATAHGGIPMIAASGGRTVVAWISDESTAGGRSRYDLWVAEPAGPPVKLGHSRHLDIVGLTSHAGKAALLTFENEANLYIRIQTT